jgi:sarcosine oxidase, subunit gamma
MSLRSNAWLREATPQRRFGVKGPRAAELIRQLKLSVPGQPNSWSPLRDADRDDSWNVIGRLGSTEFFIEEAGDASGIAALEKLTREGAPGAYPVLREDIAVVLGGPAAPAVLAQVCNVNFAVLPPRAVVMTLMIGVSVLVLPQETDEGRVYRIWCDPSFGSYLQSELEKMVDP